MATSQEPADCQTTSTKLKHSGRRANTHHPQGPCRLPCQGGQALLGSVASRCCPTLPSPRAQQGGGLEAEGGSTAPSPSRFSWAEQLLLCRAAKGPRLHVGREGEALTGPRQTTPRTSSPFTHKALFRPRDTHGRNGQRGVQSSSNKSEDIRAHSYK